MTKKKEEFDAPEFEAQEPVLPFDEEIKVEEPKKAAKVRRQAEVISIAKGYLWLNADGEGLRIPITKEYEKAKVGDKIYI